MTVVANRRGRTGDSEQEQILLAVALANLTVEQPVIALHGTWALVTQHLFYI